MKSIPSVTHNAKNKRQTLCEFCSYQLPQLPSVDQRLVMKGRSLDELLESSTRCPSCMELNDVLRGYECELHDLGQGATIALDVHLVSPQHVHGFERIFHEPSNPIPKVTTRSSQGTGLDPDQRSDYEPEWFPKAEKKVDIYANMRSCFSKCLANHSTCRQDNDRWWLPTRLIDVKRMKLKSSTQISRIRGLRYAALSHQWGTSPFFTLTQENLDRLTKDGIRPELLRRTFVDAIEATRQLGIRYLWIDSLCIIQGSKDQSEWHREAASMAEVYRNAIVTLAASDAAELDEGFFGPTAQSEWLKVGYPEDNSMGMQLLLSKNSETPLSRRAWVLQEHLLAPRTIHFGESMAWECRETTIKQTRGRLSTMLSYSTPKVWTAGLRKQDYLGLWKQMVVKYSDCLLTVPSDKLVAISGLARLFAEVSKCDYLAGFWKDSLAEDLLWETSSWQAARVGRYRGE
jgi:hypothetical protein